MGGSGCTCGFLPCICVGGGDDVSSPKAKLRQLVAANATAQCLSCMMMPCICPADDEPLLGEDGATSVEAASPLASDHDRTGVVEAEDEPEDAVTDEYGRVPLTALDADSPKTEDDVWVAREIKPLLKPHQVEGVRFLHSHVAAARGCILADYMGLGKTLQVITVIYSFLVDELDARSRRQREHKQDSQNHDGNKPPVQTTTHTAKTEGGKSDGEELEPPATVLVLCPAICLPNWESEFHKWLGIEARARCPVLTLDASTTKGTTAGRLRLLQRWKRSGGVLLMGYEMFRSLLNPTATTTATSTEREASLRVCSRVGSATMEVTSVAVQAAAKAQRAAREFHRLLCAPGADLVVLDEGHRMKDPSSLLCQSVGQIRSPRRLVLTGYPVQNSLSEYWCMVNFAREGFLGSYEQFRAKYERPILEGNSTRSQELISRLQSVVLRRGKALLRSQLPPKTEWILYCKLSPVQHRLYCDFLDSYGDAGGVNADLLTAYAALLQVMNHPDIIYSKLCPSQDEGSALLLQEDEGEASDAQCAQDEESGWVWESEERLQEKRQIAAAQRRKKRQKLSDRQKSYEWARSAILGCKTSVVRPSTSPAHTVTDSYHTEVVENSGKMAVLLSIVEESFRCGDKVVVFSQSVPTLKVIGDFLRASAFSPSRAADDAARDKVRKRPSDVRAASKLKRRRIAARPNRDPAGILRKRRSKTPTVGVKERKSSERKAAAAAASVGSSEWFLQIDGSTNGPKRMEYIKRFSAADSGVKLLLVSTRAGAEGINLHAANRLVLFDVSWNPSNDHQSMCRSHRIGQAKTVHVYRLVSTGTMERMIYEQQMKKVDLSTSVVDNYETALLAANETCVADGAAGNDAALAPYSGFLQAPAKPDYAKKLKMDTSTIEDDDVLVSCVEKLSNWLVDVHPVHELLDEAKPRA